MLTDDEKRELINKALAKSDDVNHEQLCNCGQWPESCATYDTRPWVHDAEFVASEVLRLADALEGTLTEPEWEWGTQGLSGFIFPATFTSLNKAQEFAKAVSLDRGVVRRRKAGPWEEVPDV